MEKIVFLLPARGNTPVGGYKVVFEYANRFAAQGSIVEIIYPVDISLSLGKKLGFRSIARYVKIALTRSFSCRKWFPLSRAVKERWCFRITKSLFSCGDRIVATACETAYVLMQTQFAEFKRFYLIQHYEDWVDQSVLDATWKSDLIKIVIADWLMDKAKAYGVHAELVENGLDFSRFSVDLPIETKRSNNVAMLWHRAENKGSAIGLAALEAVQKRKNVIEAVFFGIPKRPANLPDWIEYYQRPTQDMLRKIYNEAAVFVAPSLSEGFGLTAAEAMQCGCAVASSDAGGFLQFCRDQETALVSPAGDTVKLSNNIESLLENDELRLRIARGGNMYIKAFTWDRAFSKMRKVLLED